MAEVGAVARGVRSGAEPQGGSAAGGGDGCPGGASGEERASVDVGHSCSNERHSSRVTPNEWCSHGVRSAVAERLDQPCLRHPRASLDADPLGAVVEPLLRHVLVVTGLAATPGDARAAVASSRVGDACRLALAVALVTELLVELTVLDAGAGSDRQSSWWAMVSPQTFRSTVTTLPRMVASVPSMGS